MDRPRFPLDDRAPRDATERAVERILAEGIGQPATDVHGRVYRLLAAALDRIEAKLDRIAGRV
jgi:hypothetical protein